MLGPSGFKCIYASRHTIARLVPLLKELYELQYDICCFMMMQSYTFYLLNKIFAEISFEFRNLLTDFRPTVGCSVKERFWWSRSIVKDLILQLG